MQRRTFAGGLGLACVAPRAAAAVARPPWASIEASVQARLGVAVLDTADGHVFGHRLDERFPLCSTFKWLAASLVLERVDAGRERLERRIRYGRDAVVPGSPISGPHAGVDGMTVGELCAAAITVSDNAAANLLLASFGGPPAVTRHARRLGDSLTRLDRIEPNLNEARPGDPRDTTTPRAMSRALRVALFGNALAASSRAQLLAWLEACETGGERLRAGLPAAWRVGDKTGTGNRGSTNDVAVCLPPGRAPLIIAAYLTGTTAAPARCNAAIAEVARAAVQATGA